MGEINYSTPTFPILPEKLGPPISICTTLLKGFWIFSKSNKRVLLKAAWLCAPPMVLPVFSSETFAIENFNRCRRVTGWLPISVKLVNRPWFVRVREHSFWSSHKGWVPIKAKSQRISDLSRDCSTLHTPVFLRAALYSSTQFANFWLDRRTSSLKQASMAIILQRNSTNHPL